MIEKIAIVADIHANKYALYNFLRYIDKEDIKCVLNIGDFVQIGPNPYEVSTKVLNDTRFINILGNNETSLFEIDKTKPNDEIAHRLWTKEQMKENFEKIKTIPKTKILTKNSIRILMLHSMKNDINGMSLMYTDNMDSFVKDFYADIILFGHTHEKLYFEYNGKTFINPGSLGCSKNGTVDFVILKLDDSQNINCDFKSLEYDKNELIKDYYNNNVPDKEFLIKTFFKYIDNKDDKT